jgi:hypothetical protein
MQTSNHTAAPSKSGTPFIVIVIGLILCFCLALAGIACSAYLYVTVRSDRNEIKTLKENMAPLGGNPAAQATVAPTATGNSQPAESAEPKSKPEFRVSNITKVKSSEALAQGVLIDYCNVAGDVTCDSDSPYFVILKITGDANSKFKVQFCCVYVVGGSGRFSAFDVGNIVTEPNYTIEVLGYIPAIEK